MNIVSRRPALRALLGVFALLSNAGCAVAGPVAPSAGDPPANDPVTALGMTQTFSDDFQARDLNLSKWVVAPTSPLISERTMANNAELEVYFDASYLGAGIHVFSIANGVLQITAAPLSPDNKRKVQSAVAALPPNPALAPLKNLAYSSGRITTRGKFSQLYGYFEMRAKVPAGKGLWPAFWLLPADGSWPPEIDVMEILGHDPNTVHSTVHSSLMPQQGYVASVTGASTGYHRYGVLWSPTRITYYMDGVRTATAQTPPDARKPMYIIANLAVGGYWPGNPDASTVFPATLNIDYIRAYQYRPGTAQ